MGLFKKAVGFTDIHWGRRGDSAQHNQDCLDYVAWLCQRVRDLKCDHVFFLGDWFENQIRIRSDTQTISERAITMLNSIGVPIIWLLGNHDVFQRTNRDIHSLPFLPQYPNVELISSIRVLDDVALCPWPVGDEFAAIPELHAKYVFGHFDLPHFLLNQMIENEDKGGLHSDHFHRCESVFTGHFHKRQLKINANHIPIWYIGNTFPMDFNDLHDNERGMMILEWGHEAMFEAWPNAPSFQRCTVSALLDRMENDTLRVNDRSTIECHDDVGLSDDELIRIREAMAESIRNFIIRPKPVEKAVDETTDTQADTNYANFSDLVIDNLRKVDTQGRYRNELLIELWEEARS